MRALTVQQPWAWAIVHGGKDVENRTRNIAGGYRGPVLIHAGLQVDQGGVDHELLRPEWAAGRGHAYSARGTVQLSYPTAASGPGVPFRTAALLPLGAVVGVVDLVDVHPSDHDLCQRDDEEGWHPLCSRWGQELDVQHLELADPRPLTTPIPAKGRLGLWTPDQALVDAVLEQLVEASA